MYFGEKEREIYDLMKLSEEKTHFPITNEVMAHHIIDSLKLIEDINDCVATLDYATCERFYITEITNRTAWKSIIYANVVTGGSEGIYIDWGMTTPDGDDIPFGTLKTLDTGLFGYVHMGTISGVLIMMTEAFVYENDEFFAKEEKLT